MKEVKLKPVEIKKILIENIKNRDAIFVFPTGVDCNSWIEWSILNPEESGVKAVALEQFCAWDKFKINFISDREKTRKQIPSLLKKVFVQDIINKNIESTKNGNPIIKNIISPKYVDNAFSFTNWITGNLSSLNYWFEKYSEWLEKENIKDEDQENLDYLYLYNEYKKFLDDNNFFEPSWQEPEFSLTDKQIFIFYPEIIEDFTEYEEAFYNYDNVTKISLPLEEMEIQKPAYKFTDARSELRRTLLKIRELVKNEKCNYTDISLSIPEIETYIPYIKREAEKYCVPIVIRAGSGLTKNSAGRIFLEFKNFVEDNFSFDSVRSLFLDSYIPWKYEYFNEAIVREGSRLHCILNCDSNDIWEKALDGYVTKSRDGDTFVDCKTYYISLKNSIKKICNGKTFEEINKAWFTFKNTFLKEDGFDSNADNILSRCIIQLEELITLENDYIIPLNLSIENHYSFFVNELESISYAPQTEVNGVSVFPYKVSALANFKYQFVINCSQNNLTISYKKLDFLNTSKRTQLGIVIDDNIKNVSNAFISLYAKNKKDNYIQFSYCEESFSGFSIAHNFLKLEDEKNPLNYLDDEDFFINEKELFFDINKNRKKYDSKIILTHGQRNAFNNWKKTLKKENDYKISNEVVKKINTVLKGKRLENLELEHTDNSIVITQNDMTKFFPCPRKWLLSEVLKVREDSINISLYGPFDIGKIKHKALESLMKDFLKENKTLPITIKEENVFAKEEEIRNLVLKYVDDAIHDLKEDYARSPLTLKVLESEKNMITDSCMNFLHKFCVETECENGVYTKNITTASKKNGFGGASVFAVEEKFNKKIIEDVFGFGIIDAIYKSNEEIISNEGNVLEDKNTLGIVDYKNKTIRKNNELNIVDDELLDFQMPMYYYLARENLKNNVINFAKFYSIEKTDNSSAVDIYNREKHPSDYEEVIELFKKYVEEFNKVYTEKDYEPKTNPLRKTTITKIVCSTCKYKEICRYTYSISGNEIKREKNESK